MVERMDAGIATLLDELDRWRLLDDTLVIFTSDNGPWMRAGSIEETTVRYNLGLAGGKELVHEGGIRVPDDRALAGGDRQSPAPTTPSPTSPTGCPRCSPSPITATPGGCPATASTSSRCCAATRRSRVPPRFWQWSRYEPTPFANAAGRDGDWKLRYPAVPELFDILAGGSCRGASPRRRPARLPTAGAARAAHPPAGSPAGPALRPLRRPGRAVRCRRPPPATRRPHGGAVRRLVRERRGGATVAARGSVTLAGVQCDMVPSRAIHDPRRADGRETRRRLDRAADQGHRCRAAGTRPGGTGTVHPRGRRLVARDRAGQRRARAALGVGQLTGHAVRPDLLQHADRRPA